MGNIITLISTITNMRFIAKRNEKTSTSDGSMVADAGSKLNLADVRRSALRPSKPQPGDYFETYAESNDIDKETGLTWMQVYKRDLAYWKRHYA